MFPWAQKGEFCVFERQLKDIDEGHFYGSFQRNFLRLRYFSSKGVYVVQDIHRSHPYVEMFVFQRDDEVNFKISYICVFDDNNIDFVFKAKRVQTHRLAATNLATELRMVTVA